MGSSEQPFPERGQHLLTLNSAPQHCLSRLSSAPLSVESPGTSGLYQSGWARVAAVTNPGSFGLARGPPMCHPHTRPQAERVAAKDSLTVIVTERKTHVLHRSLQLSPGSDSQPKQITWSHPTPGGTGAVPRPWCPEEGEQMNVPRTGQIPVGVTPARGNHTSPLHRGRNILLLQHRSARREMLLARIGYEILMARNSGVTCPAPP